MPSIEEGMFKATDTRKNMANWENQEKFGITWIPMWDLRVELVKSNLNRVEEIELDLVGKSEPMEIFVLMLVKIDCNGF